MKNIFIFVFCLISNFIFAQYSETFDTDDKGILIGPCTTNDPTTCTSFDFTNVNWTIEGNLSGLVSGVGGTADDFQTSGGVLTSSGDIDEEICWVSPELDISSAGNDVDFSVDISYTGFDSGDYMDVEYRINGGAWTVAQPDLVGTGGHTINGPAGGSNNDVGIAGGLSGNTLQIRVCADFNSLTETFTADNVEVLDAGVSVLPVELFYFDAFEKDNQVIIYWATANEKNNNYFIIERSSDGVDFEEIGRKNGFGDSYEVRNYQFSDTRPNLGINYYRLRQVDFDGREEIHKTVSVNIQNDNTVDIYPNPVTNEINVKIPEPAKENTFFEIRDLSGRLFLKNNIPALSKFVRVEVSNLPSGIYTVKIIGSGLSEVTRFVK